MRRNRSSGVWLKKCIFGGSIISLIFIVIFAIKISLSWRTDIDNFTVQSLDGEILVDWDISDASRLDSVTITVSDETTSFSENLNPYTRSYSFVDGVHGNRYTISAKAGFKDGTVGVELSKDALFLNYDELPNLPLISITTINGENPTCEVAVKDDEVLWGETITNNDYITGSMVMSQSGKQNIMSQLEIKIRGNTTSVYFEKKSYKIRLENPIDLFQRGNEYADKEWILLNTGTSLNAYIGEFIGNICEMEWQPKMEFVNVMLNNDWKGCYILIEAVTPGTTRCNISNEGYIFENDAYWWSEDGKYFKTENQLYQMGYTFKYPKIESGDDDAVTRLRDYMNQLEVYCLERDEKYANYIDVDSLASWILGRDILGERDGGGANMFLYKYDFNKTNVNSTKVKIGPLWDFDNSFYKETEWSASRSLFYFPELFEMDSFSELYNKKWDDISESLYDNIDQHLNELYINKGVALQESWDLDSSRWSRGSNNLETIINQNMIWFSKRIDWINENIK